MDPVKKEGHDAGYDQGKKDPGVLKMKMSPFFRSERNLKGMGWESSPIEQKKRNPQEKTYEKIEKGDFWKIEQIGFLFEPELLNEYSE